MTSRRATARDVAELAGVSRSAVSLVFNGRAQGMIAADKQEAIWAAARQLDYAPNQVAASLRNQRTNTIGLVTDCIASSAYAGHLVEGATLRAAAAGYMLLMIDTREDAEHEVDAYRTLSNRHVDAVLFAAISLAPHPIGDVRMRPAALANCFDPAGVLPGIVPDEVGGGRKAMQVLLDAGHRDIVHLGGTPDVTAAVRRLEGMDDASRDAGLVPARRVIGGWDIAGGYRAATAVLEASDRPTALTCANDRAAMGAVLAAARLGLRVPADVSIVGYDDDDNVAPCLVPPLTTVALPHRAIGEQAMDLVIGGLRGEASTATGEILVDCPLVERASVAPPASEPE